MSRYTNQLVLPEIGKNGQDKLDNAKVLVVGCGGLGVPLVTYLVAMGIGEICIMDSDKVEEKNLHRQFIYTPNDLGKFKVEVMAERLVKQNPFCRITPIIGRFSSIEDLKQDFRPNLICDCTDNLEARKAINQASIDLKIPTIYAAVSEWTGYVTILNGKEQIRLNDLHPFLNEEPVLNCAITGIVPSICGTIATIQATETLKVFLSIPTNLDGSVLAYNALNNKINIFHLQKKL